REGIMNQIRPKQPRLRLDPEPYDQLRRRVLRRDGWRCQSCGARSNVEVHHKEFRSQGGNDSERNLITLCVVCHSRAHCCTTTAGVQRNRLRKDKSTTETASQSWGCQGLGIP